MEWECHKCKEQNSEKKDKCDVCGHSRIKDELSKKINESKLSKDNCESCGKKKELTDGWCTDCLIEGKSQGLGG